MRSQRTADEDYPSGRLSPHRRCVEAVRVVCVLAWHTGAAPLPDLFVKFLSSHEPKSRRVSQQATASVERLHPTDRAFLEQVRRAAVGATGGRGRG